MSSPAVPEDRAGGAGESGPAYRPPTGWLASAAAALPYPLPEPSGETTHGVPGGAGQDTGCAPDPDEEADDRDVLGLDLGVDPDALDDDATLASGRSWRPADVPDIDFNDLPTRPPANPRAPRATSTEPSVGSWDRRFEPGWPPPEPCPHCGTRRLVTDAYCLGCHYEFTTGRRPTVPVVRQLPAAGPAWSAVIEVDPVHFGTLIGDDLRLPAERPPRVVTLENPEILIGARPSRAEPVINLTGPLDDPAVSGRHAGLVRQPDGSYAVVDHGSRNGTRVNRDPEPIRPGRPVPLRDGDRVFVGAWTRITLRLR